MSATTAQQDRYNLYAVLEGTSEVIRIGRKGMPFEAALVRWTEMDNARQDGHLPHITYLAVRNDLDPDPRWQNARKATTEEVQTPGSLKGYKTLEAAARKLGNLKGMYGALGGWIYNRHGEVITQGWWHMGCVFQRNSQIIKRDGRYYIFAKKF